LIILPNPNEISSPTYCYMYSCGLSYHPVPFDSKQKIPTEPTYRRYGEWYIKLGQVRRRKKYDIYNIDKYQVLGYYWAKLEGYAICCPFCNPHGGMCPSIVYHNAEVKYAKDLPPANVLKCNESYGCNRHFVPTLPFPELVKFINSQPNGLIP